MIAPAAEADLEPQIISMAVPPFVGNRRAPPIFRIKQVGVVYFVEGLQMKRPDAITTKDEWKVVAVSKPNPAKNETPLDARMQAIGFMQAANTEAIQMSQRKKS